MRILFTLFFVLLFVQPAHANTTPAQMRSYAYEGDFQAIEDSLARAHQASLAGDISFDELRALVDAITTTHPTFLETTDAWLEAYPDSPYANTARAFQYRIVGWNIRGSGPARQIPRDALALFTDYQKAAAEHALTAYQAAPDFVSASDAVFRLQPVVKMLPRLGYLGIVANVMQTTPNLGSLERASGFAEPGWGGDGLGDISFLCDAYAGIIPDPTYDKDICVVHLSYASGWRDGELSRIWANIDNRTHPSIAYAWAYRVTAGTYERRDQHDITVIESYLRGAGQTDYTVADRFMRTYDTRGPERRQILTNMENALTTQTRAEIEHDPFNPRLIRILLRNPSVMQVNINDHLDELTSENYAILKSRLAVASPFRASHWLEVARAYSNDTEDYLANRAMPYFANALFYSDHDIHIVEQALLYTIDLLAVDHYTRNPNEPEIKVTSETQPEFVCQFVRLDRIATRLCRGLGIGPEQCPEIKAFRPDYDRHVSEARATRICTQEATASFGNLKYGPTEISLGQLSQRLSWD